MCVCVLVKVHVKRAFSIMEILPRVPHKLMWRNPGGGCARKPGPTILLLLGRSAASSAIASCSGTMAQPRVRVIEKGYSCEGGGQRCSRPPKVILLFKLSKLPTSTHTNTHTKPLCLLG